MQEIFVVEITFGLIFTFNYTSGIEFAIRSKAALQLPLPTLSSCLLFWADLLISKLFSPHGFEMLFWSHNAYLDFFQDCSSYISWLLSCVFPWMR